jgi:fructokinase
MPHAAEPTLPPAPAAVAVLGEALVDCYPDGTAVPGGAPFNVARWLGAFGVPTLFVTRIGRGDSAAAVVRGELQRFGLPQQGVQVDATQPTGVVQVLPDSTPGAGGHRFEIATPSAWDFLDAATALPLLQASVPRYLYFGTLATRHATSRAAIQQLARATAALRFVDLNLRPIDGLQSLAEQALELADWVKVNDLELQTLLQWFVCAGASAPAAGTPEHTLALQRLSTQFGVQRWVITLGERGWATADAQGRIDAHGPAEPVQPVQDTVGAGDAFAATTLAGLAHGWDLSRALQAANRLASAVCGWRGALPASDALIAHWRAALGFSPAATTPASEGKRTP